MDKMINDFALVPTQGKPRLLFADTGYDKDCLRDFARFEKYGMEHSDDFDHVAYGVSMDTGRISPQGNVVAEEDWFDAAYVSLTYYASADGELEKKMFYWACHRVRTGGVLVVLGSSEALKGITDIMLGRCESVSVRKVDAYGTLFQIAGVIKPRYRGLISEGPVLSREESRALRLRNRLALDTINAFLANPQSCSVFGCCYEVAQGNERVPGFYSHILDRRSIGKLATESPLSWIEQDMTVDRRKIRVPRALSVGNMAKVAADGQMDGFMEGTDGTKILAKGVTREVSQQFIEEGPDGTKEVCKLLQHKVFMYWFELTDELPLKYSQLA